MGTHLDLFQRIVISTCSVSAVAYSMSGPVVLTVNSTGGSLSELRPS
jgi:probable phosphoglycerate mutase